MIKTRHRIMRYRCRTDFRGHLELWKEWTLFGVRVWKRVIDREDIPRWSLIEKGCFGSTQWKSRLWKEHGHLIT